MDDVPPRRILQLPRDLPAVRTARHATEEWIGEEPHDLRTTVATLVTEMVSNAIRYGRPPIQVELSRTDGHVRIAVSDEGGGEPRQRTPGASGGWGLLIIERLASRWGVTPGTAEIWAEIDV
jgi:anti-sigma regulatory factor (Ser/Thr protein kinase)